MNNSMDNKHAGVKVKIENETSQMEEKYVRRLSHELIED